MVDLEKLDALCEAATPGEWGLDVRGGCVAVYSGNHRECLAMPPEAFIYYRGGKFESSDGWTVADQDINDAAFIAASRQAVPELVAEVRRLQADNERWQSVGLEMIEHLASGNLGGLGQKVLKDVLRDRLQEADDAKT